MVCTRIETVTHWVDSRRNCCGTEQSKFGILCFVFIIRFIYRLNRFWFMKKFLVDKHNDIISTLVQRCDNTAFPYLQHGFFLST